jgi:hypothetical protein
MSNCPATSESTSRSAVAPGGSGASLSVSPRAAARPDFATLAARVWSRAAQFADQPSLFAIALLLDLAFALIPSGLHIHKENFT